MVTMMRSSILSRILLSVILASWLLVTGAQYDVECRFRSNVTDVEELAHHKYQVLEDCLFYKLSQEADKMQGKGNALMLLPPTLAPGETLDVDILSVVVRQMWMNEVWREMNINGYISLSWKDRRMKWDAADWKTDVLSVKSYGRLWVPDINSDKHQTSAQSGEYVQYQNILAKNNGNMTARLEFKIQAHCQIDYTNFPDDRKYCCFTMKSLLYPHYIKYFLTRGERGIDLEKIRTNWHIEMATIRVEQDEDDRKAQVLEVCLTVQRRSMTLRIELTIPMMVSSLFVVIAPFFGTFKDQLNIKLFAILIQLLSFTNLAGKTPQVGFGNTIPNIYVFYVFTLATSIISLLLTLIISAMARVQRKLPPDVFYVFTLATSIISLLLTLIISAMARVQRKLPPAHRYTLLASVLNTNLCCGSEPGAVTDGTSSKDNQNDWMQIHIAINNLVSFIILIAYTIGIVVILCN
ncbi:Acetylcholine receptor subunit beta [Toxocara canis]|uniref:Acetylcholine receptor subunit beta n=1 Tax=Toxocara canis TaxID=6265 RepID=A0A0B2VR37_TOXCA|nr:Acetylcholine receptor subunit beta [Toxocara canis]